MCFAILRGIRAQLLQEAVQAAEEEAAAVALRSAENAETAPSSPPDAGVEFDWADGDDADLAGLGDVEMGKVKEVLAKRKAAYRKQAQGHIDKVKASVGKVKHAKEGKQLAKASTASPATPPTQGAPSG